jgi:uncharacterized iron-regulated membrane protein
MIDVALIVAILAIAVAAFGILGFVSWRRRRLRRQSELGEG